MAAESKHPSRFGKFDLLLAESQIRFLMTKEALQEAFPSNEHQTGVSITKNQFPPLGHPRDGESS